MNSTIVAFLRKFLATLYTMGVHEIPFSGEDYTSGVAALEATLSGLLPEDKYDEISDIFIKTPVQEEYTQLKDKLISLNGDIVGFSALENPYWKVMSIKMTPYYAEKIMEEEDAELSSEQLHECAVAFCDAAGVLVW